MNWMKPFAVILALVFLSPAQVLAQGGDLTKIIESPVTHVWDRDDLFRHAPEALGEISKILTTLEEEHDVEVYLVTYSSLIGEKARRLGLRCHEKWLGEENDGLVLVLSFNDHTSSAVGLSDKLYHNHFIERGLMPRVSYVNLQTMMQHAMAELQKEEDRLEQSRVFARSVADEFKERLEVIQKQDSSRESYHFMGWMALLVLVCGALIALLNKLVSTVGKDSKKTYVFPDFSVAPRLKAANGGGKISVVDFGSLPSSGEQ